MEETPEITLEQQLAEAEERGYHRGLNEQISKQMAQPGQWEAPDSPAAPAEPDGAFEVLANRRRSIWDVD